MIGFLESVATVDLSPDISPDILCTDAEFVFLKTVSLDIFPQFCLGYSKDHDEVAL